MFLVYKQINSFPFGINEVFIYPSLDAAEISDTNMYEGFYFKCVF